MLKTKKRNTFKVLIGASMLGVEILDKLVKKGNDVVVIDKHYEANELPPSAALRNQHTLQSGILQRLGMLNWADNSEYQLL